MKALMILPFFMSLNVFSLDGGEFFNCFKKSLKVSIEEFEEFEVKNPKLSKSHKSRVCKDLSADNYREIKLLFVEFDKKTLKEYPYDAEDMELIKIKNLAPFLSSYVRCYKNYSTGEGFIDLMANKVSFTKNKNLIENAIGIMTKVKSPKDSEKTLGEVDLSFCQR